MTGSIPSWLGVATSALLVLVAMAVAVRARLGMAREIAVAAARAAVQLAAVGAVLGLLFDHGGPLGSVGWISGMVVLGGRVAARRGRGLPRVQLMATAALAVAVGSTLGLLVATQVISGATRVVVPVGGMVVSAGMQGLSVVLLRLRDEVDSGRPEVEARLALGLSGSEAFAPQLRRALRSALAPQVDSVRTVGLIALPGAMTGLVLAGVAPLTAIRYQVVVMYQLLGAVAVAGLVGAVLCRRALFDEAERLRVPTA